MKDIQLISEKAKGELQLAAAGLSKKIKENLGEVELWYKSNRLWREIDNIPTK